jgi:O-antigen/teichoic acid export membrane protein
MNVERQIVIALKWSTAAKLASQAISWAVTLIVIRLLVPEDYGLMALSAVVITVVAGVAEWGLGASLVQTRDITPQELARVAGAILLFNAVCALFVFAAAPFFASLFADARLQDVVRVSALQFVFNGLSAAPEALAYRGMRFKRLAGVDLGAGLVTSATTLGLALSGAGVWSLVVGNLAGSAARTCLLILLEGYVRPAFAPAGIGKHIRFGGALSAGRLAWQLTYQADVLIAGRFLAEQAVGVYSVAVQLANLPLHKAMGILNQVAFPAIARMQDELPRMRARLLDAIRLLGFGSIPALWGIAAVAPEFVIVVLGESWQEVTLPLQAVALVAPLRMTSSIFATAMSALGRADLELRNTLVSVVVFPLAFLAGVRWGVNGLATAYAVATPLTFAMNFPRTSRTLGITLADLVPFVRAPLLAGIAMLMAVWLARLAMAGVAEPLRLAALITVGAVVYLVAVLGLDKGIWTDVRRVASVLQER